MATFERRFIGDPQTSLLLIALTLASRWRFTFFEKWRDTQKQFDPERSDVDFQIACKQLEYNMEWMENEGVELGLDDPAVITDAFGGDMRARVEYFYAQFHEAKKKMKRKLPQTFENLKPEDRPRIRQAIIEFLTSIKQQNQDFLKLCVDKYAERIHAE